MMIRNSPDIDKCLVKREMPEIRRRMGVLFLAVVMLVLTAQGLQFIPWTIAPPLPPTASFTYTPTAPLVNETVTFDASNSTGTIVTYKWDFGDGFAETPSPIITWAYMGPGTYNVTLKVIDDKGLWDTASKNITVYAPPIAIFTYSPSEPVIDETVIFNASGSHDLDGSIMNYTWNFGDGTNGTGINVTHAYTAEGNYTVTLNITDNDGLTNSTSKSIRVTTNYPTASFTYSPTAPIVNQIVTFNASLSTPHGGTIVSYAWNFGDGTETTEADPIVYHNYTTTGTFNVTLNVTDSEGLWSTDSKSVMVVKYPIASFTYSPISPLVGETVTFNASTSKPDGGFLVSYAWNFDDETLISETSPITSHAYRASGNYNVTLNVTDSEGLWDIEYKSITVLAPPVASFNYSPTFPIANETITFNATTSQDPDGTIQNYTWNFGDGNITTVNVPIIIHSYNTFGSYIVRLTVIDNDGYNNSASKTVEVNIHDVAILNIASSANEVNLGQVVDITVVVKNKGTVNETFDVTLYYNYSLIEKRTITDLLPNEKRTLKFSWNTTSAASDVDYVIRAEASVVSGEMYVEDNTYIDGTVKVRSQSGSQSFDWSHILPYLLPISLGSAFFFIAGFLWKKRAAKRRIAPSDKVPAASKPSLPEEEEKKYRDYILLLLHYQKLQERYQQGQISREEYLKLKAEYELKLAEMGRE